MGQTYQVLKQIGLQRLGYNQIRRYRSTCHVSPYLYVLNIAKSRVLKSSETKQYFRWIMSNRRDYSSKLTDADSPEPSASGASSPGRTKFSATKEELKARLSPIQYQVTQLKSTERPGSGEYNKFNRKGAYHCVVCDVELFKSDSKFESGCGWPAFYGASDLNHLKFVKDYSLVSASNLLLLTRKSDCVRLEVLCSNCDAHLGHRFDDGPPSKGGHRYCINSAALNFKPASD